MKKNNLFIYAILLFISIVIFSCKKTATNVLVGSWKLTAQNNTIITTNGLTKDTVHVDTTINPAASEILEFNGNNTYAVTDYSTSPLTVSTGKYTFSGSGSGAIVMTPDATLIPVTNTYKILPANSAVNSRLVFVTSTSGAGFTETDSTIYVFF